MQEVLSLCFLLACLSSLARANDDMADETRLLVVTVATDPNDGYLQYMKSSNHFGLNVTVVGMGEKWRGLGQKVIWLVRELAPYKDDKNLIILFTDSYDVVFLAGKETILSKFKYFNSSLVFSAEEVCWPDELAERHPNVSVGKRYLNSGGYIGYAPSVYEALSSGPILEYENDQGFFQYLYFNEEFKTKHNMKLDHQSYMFQNLKDAEGEVRVVFNKSQCWIKNIVHNTVPVMIHGQGIGRRKLLTLSNYVPDRWSPNTGCKHCDDHVFSLQGKPEYEFPEVLMAIFSTTPTPFFKIFLERVTKLNYPKSRISLRLYVLVKYHVEEAASWLKEAGNTGYKNITFISPDSKLSERDARNDGINSCVVSDCSNYFVLDSTVMLVNQDSLRLLMEQNRTFLAPVVNTPGKLWSNFWGALTQTAYYQRSDDYLDILARKKVGVWNVPHVHSVYLIKGSLFKRFTPTYNGPRWKVGMDSDMAFTRSCRTQFLHMYVTNCHHFGHFLDVGSYTTNHLHNDMYQVFNNPLDWKDQYIHPNYDLYLNKSIQVPMPCPDVYHYPLISAKFAKELIEEMEHFGQWSPGKETNKDADLMGDNGSLPTVDIDLKKIGFERHWQHVIKTYVLPIQEKVFSRYKSEAKSSMNFVVKYNLEGQYFYRPHQEISIFTINVALSQKGVDYKGGGWQFVRYHCNAMDVSIGHTLMHPGQFTHWYEGLPIAGGTLYTLVSFIDP